MALGVGCSPSPNQAGATSGAASMRSHCVGRLLVDLPESFDSRYFEGEATLYYGRTADFETVDVRIASAEVDAVSFVAAVEQRASEIQAESNEKTKGSMLVARHDFSEHSILLRYHRSDISDRSHIHEVHLWVGGAHLVLTAESFKGDMDLVEQRLAEIARRTATSSEMERTRPGFCLGPVIVHADNDDEMASFRYRDSRQSHADLALEIEISSFARDENDSRLIRRVERSLRGFGFRPKVVRKGAIELAGVTAEEWLGSHKENGGLKHMFSAESYPETPSSSNPGIQLSLRSGEPVSDTASGLSPYRKPTPTPRSANHETAASVEEAQAVAIWDAITASVRLQ
ncbi:T6SS immunity protein Tli4 family protein [Luteimonas sp. RD2P54]|uniref:T6SS immunity protein Tli4 family protein n=1 Tax=Luteimonas endophytica TaxID=3042023 RepID=A0ABT6JAA4_9GAMM|nr:T6SS immunity protein Tli4 family protein [Luteimonas endophytica]MDH5823751.1 T6SS immunity protein Tli4 family protein [Luteimonas endophytica]